METKHVAKLVLYMGWLGMWNLQVASGERAVMRQGALKLIKSDTDSGVLVPEMNWMAGHPAGIGESKNTRV